jgi:rhodanese-related sulfurtransferase
VPIRPAWLAVCVAAQLSLAHSSFGQAPSIYDATLGEQNARTQEVSTGEMRRILADSSAIVLDTRSRDEFDAGHIPGATSVEVTGDHLASVSRIVGGDKSKALVLYCNGPFCQASRRLAEQLVDAGFTNVRRYQLGMPVWRALGGPTIVELAGIKRIFKADQTAVYFDARPADEYGAGTLPGARNAPVAEVVAGSLKMAIPEDDFNRRLVIFGRDGAQARHLADYMSKRPWHNVLYFPGTFAELYEALATGK